MDIKEEITKIINGIEDDCKILNSANDYDEGIKLNLTGVMNRLIELREKLTKQQDGKK